MKRESYSNNTFKSLLAHNSDAQAENFLFGFVVTH